MTTSHRLYLFLVCFVMSGVAKAADPVIIWNNVLLDTIRATGGPPCPISRMQAMVHVAIYEAVNSVHRTHAPYLDFLETPPGTSSTAAANSAAHRVLVVLHPERKSVYDSTLNSQLASIPAGLSKSDGIKLGVAAANQILNWRQNDGSSDHDNYVIGSKPGEWRPTYPNEHAKPATPGWGDSLPWTMTDGDEFRPKGPLGYTNMSALLRSSGYADQVNEVKSIGSRNSSVRTLEQTRIAFFWANDLDGTYKPPGHLNAITQTVSASKKLGMQQNARLFALINLAMADAGIAAWDAKYKTSIDLWRPISAIRLASSDGNSRTTQDAAWEPLNPFTPPFPAYISGHSTFAAAHAAVMAGYFGSDSMTFTISSEDPLYKKLGGGARTYRRFSDAANENALSRVFLGVHYRFDAEDGMTVGKSVGQNVVRNFLLPIKRIDLNGDGRVGSDDLLLFSACYAKSQLAADIDADGKVTTLDLMAFSRQYSIESTK